MADDLERYRQAVISSGTTDPADLALLEDDELLARTVEGCRRWVRALIPITLREEEARIGSSNGGQA